MRMKSSFFSQFLQLVWPNVSHARLLGRCLTFLKVSGLDLMTAVFILTSFIFPLRFPDFRVSLLFESQMGKGKSTVQYTPKSSTYHKFRCQVWETCRGGPWQWSWLLVNWLLEQFIDFLSVYRVLCNHSLKSRVPCYSSCCDKFKLYLTDAVHIHRYADSRVSQLCQCRFVYLHDVFLALKKKPRVVHHEQSSCNRFVWKQIIIIDSTGTKRRKHCIYFMFRRTNLSVCAWQSNCVSAGRNS